MASNFAYCDRCYRSICLPVCLPMCLSVTFVHCAQTAEDIGTISFAHNSPMSLQIMIKFGLQYIDQLIAPQILPQSDLGLPNVDLSVGDIRWRNCGRLVRDSAMVTMDRVRQ